MFYVKYDDMDDLFKKAAENCDLNEDLAADWNKVHAALQQDATTGDSEGISKKRKKFIFFWWWLLIPFVLCISYSIGLFNGEIKQQQTTIANPISTTTPPNQPLKKNDERLNAEVGKNNAVTNNTVADSAIVYMQPKVALKDRNTFVEKNKQPGPLPAVPNFIAGINTNDSEKSKADNNDRSELNAAKNKNAGEMVSNPISKTPVKDASLPVVKKDSSVNNMQKVSTNTPAKNQQSTDTKNTKNKADFSRQAYWIIGITANTDASFIKNQQTSKVGYGGGIVAGYHLKNGFSIQTGLSLDKKNYYTKAKYFDTKRLSYFQSGDVTLNYANGNCTMWEIPVNISYDFKGGNKIKLFVTAGVSSYLMKNENYKFNYNSSRYTYDSAFNYPRSSKDFLSILNLGAGANIQAGKNILIQVQPYFKVPLKGVGIGNLSLKSAGLNISVVKQIH
ncbi:MAG: outer membrane beta-barrel protein [Chitinophagaceae bacterium]